MTSYTPSEERLLEPILGDLTYSVPMVDTNILLYLTMYNKYNYLIRSDLNQTVTRTPRIYIPLSSIADHIASLSQRSYYNRIVSPVQDTCR